MEYFGRVYMERRKVKNGSSRSSLLFFVPYIYFRPFRLSLVPTICPWVSEDPLYHAGEGRVGFKKKNSGCSSGGKSRRCKCLKTLAFPFPLPSKALLAPSTSAKKLNPHGVFSIRRWSWGSIGICHDIALLCACIG